MEREERTYRCRRGHCFDLAKEVSEKIKSMKELKYMKYEDIQENTQEFEGIG